MTDFEQLWLAVEKRVRPMFRPYLSDFDGVVEEVGAGEFAGKVKVRRPTEEIPTADLLWSPVYGAVPSVGAVVFVAVSATGNRRVITGGGGSGGGGVVDHGTLSGLGDDDHPQYALFTELTAEIDSHEADPDPHTQYVTNADLSGHTGATDPHPQYALDSDLTGHTGAADPHTQYNTQARGDARYKQLANERVAEQAASVGATSYPLGVSIMEITTAAGWPAAAGIVKTFRYSDATTMQVFVPKNSTVAWLRWWGAGSWSSFLEENSTVFARLGHSHTDMSKLGTGTPAAGKYLDGGSGAWTALPAGSGGAAANPITDPEWFDDFLAGGTATGDIGAMGWEITAATATQIAGEAGRPGIFRRSTAATASQIISTQLRGVVAFLATEMFDMTFAFRVPTFAGSQMAFRFGLLNATSAVPTHGIFMEYVSGEAGAFGGTCRNAGAQTRTAVLGTLDATGWYKCRIRRIDANTIGFAVNDGAEATVNTNVPAVGLFPCFQFTNGNAAVRSYDLDYWRLKIGGLAR